MKKWTVVIEITDRPAGLDDHFLSKQEIENLIMPDCLDCPPGISFQIFEVTPYPYGPDGVILKDAKDARKQRMVKL